MRPRFSSRWWRGNGWWPCSTITRRGNIVSWSWSICRYRDVCTCFSWWDGIRAGRRTLFKSGLFSVWSHRGEVQKVNCRIFHLLVSLIRFVVEMVKALIFIHDSNIVHLDLKPQNVMLVDLSKLLIELCLYISILFYIFQISFLHGSI